ncbi:aminomethyl transferase family protein [Paraburkholderia acidiphila]|uniref:Aminomethyl transferase family protein n=1 Tax=Paraburkholderia acidiphila TaxID=2571747 RepID=A0A7Z2G8C8_9BURK|nr:aminomethyl transferase family protein [Paraburkholderia acidiphila]QGZ56905.1 aminomethyl transferase family protein [Paraburkholderia acidiphila]
MTSSSDHSSFLASLRKPVQVHFDAAWGPPQYTNWVDESMSWKETCYIGDWSWLYAVRFKGPDALRLFSDISVNSMENFQIGQSKHIIHCNEDGKIIEEGILSRIGDDEVIAFCSMWSKFVLDKGGYNATAEMFDCTKYHLQGPNAVYVLEKVAGESVRDIGFMRFRTITIAGHPVTALRQGMTGELGFELQSAVEHGKEIWDAIVEAGAEFGIRQMGGRVGMLNHLEANYPTHTLDYLPALFDEDHADYRAFLAQMVPGFFDQYFKVAGSFESNDIRDWYRSPVELGWGNRINLKHEFIGREALAKEKAEPKRTIVTLVWNSDDVVDAYASFFKKGDPLPDFMEMPRESRGYMWADKVLKNGETIGVSTSRGYSAYFREMLSLCTIDMEFSQPGTEVTLIWGNPGQPQREIRAVVQRAPYKEDRARADLTTLPPFKGLR